MKKRVTSDEERREFEKNFAEKRPIRAAAVKTQARPKAPAPGSGGVNGGTADRLRRGLLEPEARIDLHGKTEAAAHRALHSFLNMAAGRGLRLLLVVTGKGNPRKDESAAWMAPRHGVLKQMVPRWLNQPEASALIAHVQPAHARHGGEGALYVYLRKKR
jgi:DNA-nicking Smr family endonuclease